ncbi:hypothetical protein KDK_09400 [Dictyobacter kobayashii]|uniref:Uncharacterized protein n=2 Tax=Dictyobacter kobayashii TaxID=2014872 RepID=A0A402ADF3_9CHLR|nr:hypothetical protein KDK_09400 [Dictyobacter kobayashii]
MLSYLGRYDEALAAYEQALRLDPQDEDLYLAQARVLVCLKRYDEALTTCQQAQELSPAKPSVYKEKGDIQTLQQRYEGALAAYQKAAQLDPKDVLVHEKIGDTFCELEQFAEAAKAYARALHLNPDFIRVYSAQAHAFKKLGRYEQALSVYNKALKRSPKNPSLLVGRAGVLKKLLRYEEANDDYSRAELLKPESLYAVICILGKVDIKQVAEAKTRLQMAGKELSDEAIGAEIKQMHQEKEDAELKASLRASPLFQPICLLMQEKREWSGTAKQFKELLSNQFPDAFAKWYRAPSKFVDELKRITPELQHEGVEICVPSGAALITLEKRKTNHTV